MNKDNPLNSSHENSSLIDSYNSNLSESHPVINFTPPPNTNQGFFLGLNENNNNNRALNGHIKYNLNPNQTIISRLSNPSYRSSLHPNLLRNSNIENNFLSSVKNPLLYEKNPYKMSHEPREMYNGFKESCNSAVPHKFNSENTTTGINAEDHLHFNNPNWNSRNYYNGAICIDPLSIIAENIPVNTSDTELKILFSNKGLLYLDRINPNTAIVTFSDKNTVTKLISQRKLSSNNSSYIYLLPNSNHKSLFIGNINKKHSQLSIKEELSEAFSDYISIRVPPDPDNSEQNRGYCFIDYDNHYYAKCNFEKVKKKPIINGRVITVDWADQYDNNKDYNRFQLHISGITKEMNSESIYRAFQCYGRVKSIKLSREHSSGRADYGFVTYETEGEALNCIGNFSYEAHFETPVKVEYAKKIGSIKSNRSKHNNEDYSRERNEIMDKEKFENRGVHDDKEIITKNTFTGNKRESNDNNITNHLKDSRTIVKEKIRRSSGATINKKEEKHDEAKPIDFNINSLDYSAMEDKFIKDNLSSEQDAKTDIKQELLDVISNIHDDKVFSDKEQVAPLVTFLENLVNENTLSTGSKKLLSLIHSLKNSN